MDTNKASGSTWFNRDGSPCDRPVTPVNATTATYDYQDTCNRCGGAGGGAQWAHTGWTCFECGGSGKGKIRTVKVYTAQKLAKLNATSEKREAKRRAVADAAASVKSAALAEWRTANAETLATIRSEARGSEFLESLLAQADLRPLSEAQVQAGLTAVQRIRERREAQARQTWIGKPGDRIEFEWTVDRVIALEDGGYGRGYYAAAPYLVVGHDANGNPIKYVGSGSFPREGETAAVRATVKGHEEYKGAKQTVIERPKLLNKPDRFAEAVAERALAAGA